MPTHLLSLHNPQLRLLQVPPNIASRYAVKRIEGRRIPGYIHRGVDIIHMPSGLKITPQPMDLPLPDAGRLAYRVALHFQIDDLKILHDSLLAMRPFGWVTVCEQLNKGLRTVTQVDEMIEQWANHRDSGKLH